ncbi:hypothetical protein KSF78_0007751 [Schistosoma japonicum]|nr:hypothetical protein KSF78_0007751 [Schistosoma japonicum]
MALSSSLLYINVLLLVLIHSSIQIENPADAIENAIEGIVEVQEELNKFERSLETTKKIIRQLIKNPADAIENAIEGIVEVQDLVNKFESSLETIDEDIRLLISTINEANPNETETLKNLTDDLQCDIDNLKKEIERDYPNCYFKVIYFSSHFQYKDNFRRAIKMLSKRKGIQQLIFNTSQSEKSNMTCNRPENISEDDFNKLQKLLGKEQRTDLASTYIKLKKKALLLVWEDLTNARVVDDLITMNILKFSQITDLLSLNTLTQIPPPVLCSHYFDHLSIAFQPLSTTYHYVIKSHHFEPVSYKNTLIIPNRLQCNITDLQ